MIRALHISDIHFGSRVSFDQDLVQQTLLEFVDETSDAFDCLIVTGDVGFSGRNSEYVLAQNFLQSLMSAMAIDGSAVAICPGNHDVDRGKVVDLSRTLSSTPDSDRYFADDTDCMHIREGQGAYAEFYKRLTSRNMCTQNSLGGPIVISKGVEKLEIWELNTSIFSRGDDDHGKLWVGRSSFVQTPDLKTTDSCRIVIGHHPLDWLASEEEMRIKALADSKFRVFLRGHLHTGGYVATTSPSGNLIQVAAGALYQGATGPIEANIVEFYQKKLVIRPYRYVDDPIPAWVPDNGKTGPNAATEIEFTLGKGIKASVTKGGEPAPAEIEVPDESAEANFTHPQLFSNGENKPIFCEPRICDSPLASVLETLQKSPELPVDQIIANYDKVQIEYDSEYGGTTLGHYLLHCAKRNHGIDGQILDAKSIPNYKAKFETFLRNEVDPATRLIVLDNFFPPDHRKVLDLFTGSDRFEKIVVLSGSLRSTSSLKDLDSSNVVFETKPLFLWPLDRPRLRSLALQVFDPIREEDVNSAVDKTYADLTSLAIPLTPANSIMYLSILKREDDFVPLDRISIIQRYLSEAMTRASDQLSTEFGIRDRLSLVASFVFDQFMLGRTTFSVADWKAFCRNFQERTFADFDVDGVYNQLLRSRVVMELNGRAFIRYAFVYDYLVGSHAASSPEKLQAFLSEGHHRRLPRVVEVMTAMALDPTPLLETLQSDLDRHLHDFHEKYVQGDYDPVALAEWKVDVGEAEGEYWAAIQSQMEEGPAASTAIDRVKESVLAEMRSADQEVVIQDFSALEVDLFRSSNALESAFRVAVDMDGAAKIRAFRSIMASELIVLQIATVFSKKLALSRAFRWGGLLFVNAAYDPAKSEDDYGDIVPWVITSIDLNISEVVSEKIASKRLGPAFREIFRRGADLSEFEIFNLFALILRTKPREWDLDLERIISDLPFRKWRLRALIQLLMHDYKNETNTLDAKGKIRHLVALIEAKRSSNKQRPGSKSVSRMQRIMEEKGRFDEGDGDATH